VDASSGHRAFCWRGRVVFPDRTGQVLFWSLFGFGLVLDLWTKKAVFDWLADRESLTVIVGFMRIVRALNNGAAFGMFAGRSYILAAVSIIAMLVVTGIFLFGGARQRLVQVALGLFAAGICGNLYDRMLNGGIVRDFLEVHVQIGQRAYYWPAFNLADSLLCLAVGLLVLSSIIAGKSAQRRAQQQR